MQQVIPRAATGGQVLNPHTGPSYGPIGQGRLGVGRLGRLARARGMRGLGAGETAQLGISAGTIAATGTVGILSAVAAGSSIALPVVGVAIAGVALAVQAILHSGCGQTCVITSGWANQAGALLERNILAYFAIPTPRPRAAQTAALANFDQVWAYLSQECGSAQVGDAGVRCISDRQSGACVWKQTPNSVLLHIPGEPQPGECWNWFSGYRDPIANDPNVGDTPESAQAEAQMGSDPVGHLAGALGGGTTGGAGGGLDLSGDGGGGVSLLLLGGLALLVLGLGGKD